MKIDERFEWYKKSVPRLSLLLGIIALIIAQFAELPQTKGLFSIISLGPVISGLIAYVRYSRADNLKQTVRVIVEASWIPFSFGMSYLVMAPSEYYNVGGLVLVLLLLNALLMIALGLSSLIYFGKRGYSLTP